MTINGMDGIMNAIQNKNKPATPSAAASMQALQHVATDSNADATPKKNALDIDQVATACLMKFHEYDSVFTVMLPAIDKMKVEHEQIMQALQQSQGGQAQAQPTPPTPPVPQQVA
jgi:hypothetical protein